jgi:DNA-binding GntR family transcriptional regulator
MSRVELSLVHALSPAPGRVQDPAGYPGGPERIGGQLSRFFELHRALWPDLAARSRALHTEDDLHRLRLLIRSPLGPVGGPVLSRHAHGRFHRALIAPAATTWDLRILDTLWSDLRQGFPTAVRRLDEAFHYETLHHRGPHHQLLAALRSGNDEQARRALLRHVDLEEDLVREVLREAG